MVDGRDSISDDERERSGAPDAPRVGPRRPSWSDLALARGGHVDRVRQIIRLSPASAASNLISATIVAAALAQSVSAPALAVWYGAACLMTVWILRQRRLADSLRIAGISNRTRRRMSSAAAVVAAPWSAACLAIVLLAPEQTKFAPFVAVLVYLVGGAIVFSAVPMLTMVFVGLIVAPASLAAAFAWSESGLYFMLAFLFLGAMLCLFALYYGLLTSEKEASERRRLESLASLRRANESITRLAGTDVVTGLLNRRAFQTHLEALMPRLRPDAAPHALFLIDLDHFKHVNDAYGHETGDRYLISVAQRLRDIASAGLTVARLGGDEFAAVSDAPLDDAAVERIGARLIETLGRPHAIDGHDLKGGCSIGVAQAPLLCANASDLLVYADQALRMAKSARRGSMARLTGEAREQLLRRMCEATDLENAVRRRQIEAYFQPQIDIDSGRLIGFEALARWRNAEGGFVSPLHFFSLAEENGFVLDLCDAIWEQIASTAAHWREAGLDFGALSVNLHLAQLNHHKRLEAALERLSLAAGGRDHVVLEVTEDCVIGRGMEHVPALLEALAALGHRISLDDFGTGFASLTHIKELPIHELKIDRKFVMDLTTSAQDQAIVKAICDIAKPRNVAVVAEGVETMAQLVKLSELGGKLAQGYFYAPPMPAGQAAHFIAMRQPMTEVARARAGQWRPTEKAAEDFLPPLAAAG